MAELPIDGKVWSGYAFATSGVSGAAVFLRAVAGFATGEVNTGFIIFGLGISTATSGFGSIFGGASCFTGIGFTAGFGCGCGGCGFQGSTIGASIGVVQYRWTISIRCGISKGIT